MGMMRDLLQWWNLLFLVPIALAAILLLVTATSGLGDADGGEIGDHADAGGGDGDGSDGDSDSAHDAHPLSDTLRAVGVGVVPISLLLQGFCLFFGIWGLTANRLLQVAQTPDSRIFGAFALALVGGMVTTGGLGALAHRFLPQDGPSTGGKDLIARSGRVIFAVDADGGTVQVRDAGGTLHQVPARLMPDQATIEAGRVVLIVSRDENGIFTVEESPFAE